MGRSEGDVRQPVPSGSNFPFVGSGLRVTLLIIPVSLFLGYPTLCNKIFGWYVHFSYLSVCVYKVPSVKID